MGTFPDPPSMDPRDEQRLAADFVARTSKGLENVYRAYSRVLYSVARRVLGNDEDAMDCVHDALLRAWQRADAYRPERGPLRAYLVVCVRNEALTRTRTATRRARIEEHVARSDDVVYEFELNDAIEQGRLHRALSALPAEQRQALALTFFGHLTHAEAAKRLDLPLGTIKGRLRLALTKLNAAMRPK